MIANQMLYAESLLYKCLLPMMFVNIIFAYQTVLCIERQAK
jgi:hypothetical protein